MYLTGTPSRAAIAAAMSGETPVGSPDGLLPVTSRKLPMLIAARRTPVGASSATTALSGISLVRKWWGRLRHPERSSAPRHVKIPRQWYHHRTWLRGGGNRL